MNNAERIRIKKQYRDIKKQIHLEEEALKVIRNKYAGLMYTLKRKSKDNNIKAEIEKLISPPPTIEEITQIINQIRNQGVNILDSLEIDITKEIQNINYTTKRYAELKEQRSSIIRNNPFLMNSRSNSLNSKMLKFMTNRPEPMEINDVPLTNRKNTRRVKFERTILPRHPWHQPNRYIEGAQQNLSRRRPLGNNQRPRSILKKQSRQRNSVEQSHLRG
jgi:hypothetical protein